ncbi:hypothetical protein [Paenibacillus sp. MSJ-34]|uniref:hypothetical protein n=1 Tax=Paenibacillus sp. MSJ-34 TaxID=2841529 RepID=UPI001C11A5B8|nr:hypothetical protein [Paenibacillus sp. MSJ-34]MBU5441416.1 hypothetical protein [Paenibacillus sp. MSJ-34]
MFITLIAFTISGAAIYYLIKPPAIASIHSYSAESADEASPDPALRETELLQH